jgi:predicted AAA+ superfamily ATPase
MAADAQVIAGESSEIAFTTGNSNYLFELDTAPSSIRVTEVEGGEPALVTDFPHKEEVRETSTGSTSTWVRSGAEPVASVPIFVENRNQDMYFRRRLEGELNRHLSRGKSILLLGPRQTGKTTLVEKLDAAIRISLVSPGERQRYEKDPSVLLEEIRALASNRRRGRRPLVVVDEVQKVPALMDAGQSAIDAGEAQFVFTGSSARKLRRGQDINLLPGRVVAMRLDPLSIEEDGKATLREALLFGALPAIRNVRLLADKETDLRSYVETYLEEEVRQEALVRNVGAFARFLELAALESGRIANFARISADVGVSAATVRAYFEILCDCLVAQRIDPITQSASRKKLTKSSRYLMFDLGVRRLAANEGTRLNPSRMGELFEQFVGLELVRLCRTHLPRARVRFWRDPDGPEVDWVVEHRGHYLPIEAKLSERPTERQTRHLRVFMKEYGARRGLVVSTAPRRMVVGEGVSAVPWQALPSILREWKPGKPTRRI